MHWEISVEETGNVEIKCGSNEIILIDSATWKFNPTRPVNYIFSPNWRNFVYPLTLAGVTCSYDKTSEVKSVCHGKDQCNFVANRELLGDECNYWLKLNVDYHYHLCNQRSYRSIESEAQMIFELVNPDTSKY